MMKKLFYVLVAMFILSGCTAELKLDDKWLPLTAVKENPVQPNGVVTTIVPYLLVRDVDNWELKFPKYSPQREALLRHERVHAYRQVLYGRSKFIYKYTTDKKFRWQEEQLANYVGLMYLKNKGYSVNVEGRARFLSGKAYNNMIKYEVAKQWILDMLDGHWQPMEELPTKVN